MFDLCRIPCGYLNNRFGSVGVDGCRMVIVFENEYRVSSKHGGNAADVGHSGQAVTVSIV